MPAPIAHDYRPDIDGLRAVAVALVMIFHVSPELLPGGFVGVDVFFVISGYLITAIILRESQAQTFTLQQFYARRCRRILPALVVVLAATWLIGYVALAPGDFRFVGKHILGGSTFTSNLLLWRETGYFDLAAIRKPLLHLWSLGVEEQFYLVWPPLLMVALLRTWRPLALSAGLLAASLVLAIVMMPAHEEATFYLLPARMWELLTGALLVQMEWATQTEPASTTRFTVSRELKAAVGLCLIGVVCFFDPGTSRGRIWWLIAPVTGAALVISAGKRLVLALEVPELDFDPAYCVNRFSTPRPARRPGGKARSASAKAPANRRHLSLQRSSPLPFRARHYHGSPSSPRSVGPAWAVTVFPKNSASSV